MSSQITQTCENKKAHFEDTFRVFGKQSEGNTGNIKNGRTNYAHFGVGFQFALESTNFTSKIERDMVEAIHS